MKYHALVCRVLMRECYWAAAHSPHEVQVELLEQALHSDPDKLRLTVQAAIDSVEAEVAAGQTQLDAILLGYGLCSNGVAGLRSRTIPLVIPRAHDCITLLLGSQERYRQWFKRYEGGIYWYSPGWIEQAIMPGKARYEALYQQYLEKYGEDNAQYLMEMEQLWMKRYRMAVYVHWPEFTQNVEAHRRFCREAAEYLHWQWAEAEGDSVLLQDWMNGKWDAERFLVVPPGHYIRPTYREDVLGLADTMPDVGQRVRGNAANQPNQFVNFTV